MEIEDRISVMFEDRRVEVVALATFNMDDYKFTTQKGLFGRAKQVFTEAPCDFALVFIPWKHREKQLAMVRMDSVLSPVAPRKDWVTVRSFFSVYEDEPYYRSEVEVRNFVGYKFICDNNNFIAALRNGENYDPLTALYENMPYLLEEEIEDE